MTPDVVTLAILPTDFSATQRLPSGPTTMPSAPAGWLGIANSVTTPVVVIRATLPTVISVNQRLPSGPVTICTAPDPAVGIENSVTLPDVDIRPIWLLVAAVNQMLPSGPLVMPVGPLPAASGNSVIVAASASVAGASARATARPIVERRLDLLSKGR